MIFWKLQQQVAERLVFHLIDRLAHHGFVKQGLGVAFLSGENKAANLGQRLRAATAARIIRTSGPDRLLVEVDALAGGAAKHHRPEPTVAHRQRFDPLAGRLCVPHRGGRGCGLQRRVDRLRVVAGRLFLETGLDWAPNGCHELIDIRFRGHQFGAVEWEKVVAAEVCLGHFRKKFLVVGQAVVADVFAGDEKGGIAVAAGLVAGVGIADASFVEA